VAETRPSQPVALYDYAKLAGEGLGIAYARAGGPEFAALRFATIYGPGKLVRHGPMSLVSRLVEDAHFGRETIIEFGADERDDLLYVRDAGRAVSQVALAGGALGHHVYNVGTGRGVTLDEVAAVVRSARPGARIEIGPGLDPMRFGVPYYGVMDATRLAEELGFRAAFDIDAGVADYLQRLGPAPPGDGAR
jgi:UDP-glucose 4-epimerase